ncbi:MAG: hypothetical protein MJH10_10360 [Epibacterium sp.]|nr:hypothetical protein [Epibacterium sp.]NQX73942.1 hypothetical protein [Epibacterium sp.]
MDVCASLAPAEPYEVATLIESLSVMYPQQARTEADDRIRARTWIADLADYPADAIEAACAQWRRKDTAFMPSPGQLIALIEPIVKARQALKNRADLVIDGPVKRTAPNPIEAVAERDPKVLEGLQELMGSLSARRASEGWNGGEG